MHQHGHRCACDHAREERNAVLGVDHRVGADAAQRAETDPTERDRCQRPRVDAEPAAAAADLPEQARRLRQLGARRVLLKGGHLDGPESVDLWLDDDGPVALRGPRVATTATHGTGCTLSSAIAALRPRHDGWLPAVREARGWLTEALRHGESLEIGAGAGPVHHFHELVRWRATT